MAIQIGKYKRPGIFIEESDNSVVTSTTVEGISTLVIGFSKKGPVNTPVLLQNINDLQNIFGPLDRNLERKGSYFHRTISKMLESSPVWAVNLLLTDDTLDEIEYQSISSASTNNNDVVRTDSYRRFFDTTGFWKRDREAFINVTKDNEGYAERILNFTNLSDKYVTMFMFKSKVKGFDITMSNWYSNQSSQDMPPYVNANDYVSDYMVDIVLVSGDWSNYSELSVDPRWGTYFNNSGLIKEQVDNFANNRSLPLLKYYTGLSLLPYFRDTNNRNIFIETVINADTDSTGLFCAFNSDLFETDYPNGLVDLVGSNLVTSSNKTIDYLSYSDTIIEAMPYQETILDTVGNVYGINGLTSGGGFRGTTLGGVNRTGYYSEGYVYGVSATQSLGTASPTSSISFTFNVAPSSYAVIGGNLVTGMATASFTILASSYTASGVTVSYTSAFVLKDTGVIAKVDNLVNSSNPAVASTDIVLGYVNLNVYSSNIVGTRTYTDVTVNNSGYKELVHNTDYAVTDLGSGSFKVEFLNTAAVPDVTSYAQYRKIKTFNNMINVLDSPNTHKATMLTDLSTMTKASMENMTVTNIVTSTTDNKSFVVNTNLTSSDIADVLDGMLLFYKTDNELVLSEYGLLTKETVAVVGSTVSTNNVGVVAKYSDFYVDYNEGLINSGDYFYDNLLEASFDINFIKVTGGSYSGNSYMLFYSSTASITLSALAQVSVPSSTLNVGAFTIMQTVSPSILGYTASGYTAYQVVETAVNEALTGVTLMYDYLNKYYLKMYMNVNNILNVQFTDSTLSSSNLLDISMNQVFNVQSDKNNFKESVDIVIPTGYTQSANKVLVEATRYTNIAIGDYLQAYVDTTTLVDGQVPRNLTRVIGKRLYPADTTLVELTCDSRIYTVNYAGNYQTTRFTPLEEYVSTYKAIKLGGFRVRQDSMPDGTENRQTSILNLISVGTPLFKALTNKESFDFRYLVDSFGLGLINNSKQQLMEVCGARLDCFGFLNMPSMRSFKNSTSPTFVDSDGVLQTSFIAVGGDPNSNPAFLYSFGEGNGASCVGYFTPYMTVNDNGRPLDVPPAMFVATTYMRKQNSHVTSIVPWTIAAGITNGKVTGIAGLEMDFNPQDIENLNQAQMNPVVTKKNRGFCIETENTAQTLYKSALSYIHVREMLIELERELAAMLLDFQWKFNTADVRAEIKLRADTICEKYVNRNGLYNYFNKCDGENNTSDIIDNQMGVIDTYVEPVKGMGIIVNNITILRTGAIQSGGFIIP